MWDGAKWPAKGTVGVRPPVLRSIFPELMKRRIFRASQMWENTQLDAIKVLYETPEGDIVRYGTPLHWAQWLGFPRELAERMIGKPCTSIVDDGNGVGEDEYSHWQPEHRPGADKFALCGTRRMCKKCGEIMFRLGQGWHIPSATLIIATALRAASDHKVGKSVATFHKFSEYEVHYCGERCQQRVTVKQVKLAQEAHRRKRPTHPTTAANVEQNDALMFF